MSETIIEGLPTPEEGSTSPQEFILASPGCRLQVGDCHPTGGLFITVDDSADGGAVPGRATIDLDLASQRLLRDFLAAHLLEWGQG